VREVRGIDARVDPAADAVSDAERKVVAAAELGDEEGVLARAGTPGFGAARFRAYGPREKGDDVAGCVEAVVFCGEGGGDAVGVVGFGGAGGRDVEGARADRGGSPLP